MELLSLTSDNDLVLAKIDNYYLCLAKIDDYYLCLAEPSKRKYGLHWYEAKDYCKSLGKDYSLPSLDELNLIYTNKGSFSLVEVCLYSDEINTLDFISKAYYKNHFHYPWVWSSTEYNGSFAWFQNFTSGSQDSNLKDDNYNWVLPVRRIKC